MMRGNAHGRQVLLLVAFAVLACLAAVFSIMKGSVEIPLEEILGAMAGVNLALSGAILQAVMKNPLADPHIIGISSGAGLTGILVMLLLPEYGALVTPAAFVGALGAAVLIYILAWKNGIRPVRIILAGVAVSAFLGAGISALMIIYSDRVHSALLFMVGGLSARSWPHVAMLWPYALIGTCLAFLGARHLNILQLGDEMARGLGLRVELTRIVMTAIAALLAASSVSVVGLLGFVGLIVPHAARLMLGTDYRFLLPGAALLGAAVLTASDTVARVAFAPVELPVGILMAALGAPFFLFLLRREL